MKLANTVVAIALAVLSRANESPKMKTLPSHVSALALLPATPLDLNPASAPIPLFHRARARGAAILSHRITTSGDIIFRLLWKSLAVDEPEIELANWLEDELTMARLVVAYDLDGCVLALLRSLIEPGQHYSLAELTASPWHSFHDLSRPRGSLTMMSFETACENAGIDVASLDPQRDAASFEGSSNCSLDDILRSRAIATWHLWLSDVVRATGEQQVCDQAAASLDAKLRLHMLPAAGAFDCPLPTFWTGK